MSDAIDAEVRKHADQYLKTTKLDDNEKVVITTAATDTLRNKGALGALSQLAVARREEIEAEGKIMKTFDADNMQASFEGGQLHLYIDGKDVTKAARISNEKEVKAMEAAHATMDTQKKKIDELIAASIPKRYDKEEVKGIKQWVSALIDGIAMSEEDTKKVVESIKKGLEKQDGKGAAISQPNHEDSQAAKAEEGRQIISQQLLADVRKAVGGAKLEQADDIGGSRVPAGKGGTLSL
jgi:hypothetical protein